MADDIQRIIYKTEIDDSGYIRGIESMATSTAKLTAEQEKQNKRLQENQAALKSLADIVEKDRKALENYAGTNAKFKKQLEDSLKSSQTQYAKTAELVATIQKQYDKANQSAQQFADTAAKATQIQQQTTGGKIPTPAAPTTAPQVIPPVVPPVAFQDFDLREILGGTTDEFEQLRAAIALTEQEMAGLNQEGDEFKQLAPLVEQGKRVLQDFDNATKSAATSQGSIREQLRRGREELVRLEQAGKGATTQYFELEKRVARLTDEFQDQQQRIRILASDTKLLDFGKAAITAATSAFQAYSAVSILVGGQSEELQKKTMQLFAAMQLLQSIEQLSNLTRREGILSTLGLSGAQSAYTAVVGASTGALKAFRIALLGTGIGAVIAGIGFLIARFSRLREEQAKAREEQQKLNDAFKSSEYKTAIENVERLRQEIDLAKQGFISKKKVVDEYNETIGKTTGQVKSLDEAEQALEKNADAYIRFTLLKAAANITLVKAAQEAVDQAIKDQENLTKFQQEFKPTPQPKDATGALTFGVQDVGDQQKEVADRQRAAAVKQREQDKEEGENRITNLKGIASNFRTQAASIAAEFGFDFFQGLTTKPDTKPVENVFAQKLKELQAKLAEVTAKSFESEGTIRKQFAASLGKELESINQLLKDKKITKPQAQQLIDLTVKINDVQLQAALDGFNKKVLDARKKLNDQIKDLQQKNNQEQVNLIQDEFDRRAQQIDANEKKEIKDRIDADAALLDALQKDKDTGLIKEQDYQKARQKIILEGEIAVNNIVAKSANQRQNLSADIFKKSLDQLNNVLSDQLLNIDEQTAAKIQEQKRFLDTGTVNYDTFQKNITKILADQKAERDRLRLLELQDELSKINARLAASISAAEREELLRRQRSVRSEIVTIQTQVDPETKKRTETVQQYVEAVGQLTDSIVAFWQRANEAERAALDRSIALQERRVDAAQRIAERGNAAYLKAEQDRLTELNIQRENAARRQLAIDAALQASQLLVGITGAISKIASGIGAAATIAEIAIIVGALATGYGLVKSLQGNQPRLKEGTPYLKRDGQPRGTDTIPAWLTEGEAVIPQEKNKKYKKSVEAIYHGKVPAEILNTFVENYVRSDKKISTDDRYLNITRKVANEVSDKKFTQKEIKILVENKTNDTINVIHSVVNQDKNVSVEQVQKYSEIINKITNIETYKKFVENIMKVPAKILTTFIENYHNITRDNSIIQSERYYFKGTPDLQGETGVDKIPIWATEHEAIIPVWKNNLYKPVINAIFEGKIPAEKFNSFVREYHTVKPVPQLNYERIKETAETHISQDSKLSALLQEQNTLLKENNALQKDILKKKIHVENSIDRNGISATVYEWAEQRRKDKRT